MVRLADLDPDFADALRAVPLPAIEPAPWITPPPLRDARIALISTAGLHRVGDRPFDVTAADYRLIPADVDPSELRMSHVSVNFDRSAFQQDSNTVFPLALLHQLAAEGKVGSVARWHYAFMGATDPSEMRDAVDEIAPLLKRDGISAVALVPV